MLEEKCEYCKYYEEDYDLECKDCRVDDGLVSYSKFELNDELEKLINLAEFNCCDCEFTYYEENCNCKYGDFISFISEFERTKDIKLNTRENNIAWWAYMAGMLSVSNKIRKDDNCNTNLNKAMDS